MAQPKSCGQSRLLPAVEHIPWSVDEGGGAVVVKETAAVEDMFSSDVMGALGRL